MCRGNKHGSHQSQYEMHEGQTVDASYALHEAHGCGRRGRGRGIRFLILLIILGAVFFNMRQNEQRVEAISYTRSPGCGGAVARGAEPFRRSRHFAR
jgi:hypothetical protein